MIRTTEMNMEKVRVNFNEDEGHTLFNQVVTLREHSDGKTLLIIDFKDALKTYEVSVEVDMDVEVGLDHDHGTTYCSAVARTTVGVEVEAENEAGARMVAEQMIEHHNSEVAGAEAIDVREV